MTETLARPADAPPGPPAGRPPRPRLVAGALAAVAAAVVGLLAIGLPVLAVWAADPRAGAPGPAVARTVGQLWLLAHGGALDVPGGRVGLLPLGLTLLPLLLLVRAGRSVARARPPSPSAAVRTALAVAVPYAGLTGAVAQLARTADVRPVLLSSVLGGLVVGLVGAGAGAVRAGRADRAAPRRLGGRSRRTLVAVGAACGVLAAAGSLLVGASLAVHGGEAAELAAATGPGVVGGAGLLLVGLALVPNAVLWGTSWLAGPGFAVGTGTAVGPFAAELGPVPALPLLAAVPATAVPGWVGALALLLPVGAGVVAAGVLHRRAAGSRLRSALADVAAVAAGCGLLWAVLAALSGGPVGGARLAELGPDPWQVGLAVAAEVGVGAAVGLLLLRRRAARAGEPVPGQPRRGRG